MLPSHLVKVITAFLLLLTSLHLNADNRNNTIHLAAEDNWAPFADHDGKGLSHQLINGAFSRVNIDVESTVVSYARGLVMAKKGLVDGVFNLHKEQGTENQFIFGEEPLFSTQASFYHNNAHPIMIADKWAIPPGTRVGVIEGYEYGDELAQLTQLKLIQVANHHQLINLLLLSRIDMVIMYDQVAKQYLNQMGVEQVIGKSVHNHTGILYVAFSKENPQAIHYAAMLDQGLRELKKDGSYNRILASITSD
ncbi:amino acid ABC transporter substrate-binding protein [Shewanella colwelliana]|uniref:Amino acid ABC transporter substrate-binding protein n=1 Tax=Shewanella colwelliana TaxID=23 RepID=A0A1E5ISN3_SHECO|nr:transporter substrate-binding domain-containing protein [Shewanella colwelliana]OEG73536.1 amino acid ABC transporter substrate-binding protein [Shewanella colwelliana]